MVNPIESHIAKCQFTRGYSSTLCRCGSYGITRQISSKDSDVVRSLKTALEFYVLQNSPAANGDGLWEAYQYGDGFCVTNWIWLGYINGIYSGLMGLMTGWWFGTWMDYDFPFSWECHHLNWRTPSFFRGVGWNHQPVGDGCSPHLNPWGFWGWFIVGFTIHYSSSHIPWTTSHETIIFPA